MGYLPHKKSLDFCASTDAGMAVAQLRGRKNLDLRPIALNRIGSIGSTLILPKYRAAAKRATMSNTDRRRDRELGMERRFKSILEELAAV